MCIAANTYAVPAEPLTTEEDTRLTQIMAESTCYSEAGSKMYDFLVSLSLAVLQRAFIPIVLGTFRPF